MDISYAYFSCTGERSGNQDVIGHVVAEGHACFVVSDGIAGEPGGEVAAQCAVNHILAHGSARPMTSAAIEACIKDANDAILAEQARDPRYRKMGATVVALFIDRVARTAQWAHLGDSRLYHFRRGLLIHRTRDHSLLQRMADAGLPFDGISPNLLDRALGVHGDIAPCGSPIQPLHDGDAFLLCTDGLWHAVPDASIEQHLRIVNKADDWLSLLRHAVSHQHAHGASMDNYSALAVWVGRPEDVTLQRVKE
ncbi:protein phosphatase 2C domain-containing protein [Paraburkholderia madseniana]|uniref:PP2C family protein-serine/threonine phosphatase n=1 Tax=Paraburkholderia madseniana TaxID=2599607 RepID=UPI0015598DE5|nr:protein phosphatase 2C domain-containing protein [Paraburkholderia madseniana]NPT68936.1 SpoIIE family protein phosphatase [Paraburkholderia madseniana]